ncbi:MAG: DinB family protein [Dehalococcoidia bacterium]|nr:DinB family protein [Dehalococcoidia bacterium]
MPEAVSDLVEKMREQREALLAEAEAFADDRASAVPSDGEGEAQWSVKQQLAHLAEMETNYRAWVEAALIADDPDVSAVRGDRVAVPLTAAQAHSVPELTAQLRAERAKTLRLIESMSPEQFDRTASQSMFGRLTVMQWLRSYYRHDRMHRDQMAGREPEYRPRFVGGREPDQRR